MIWEKPNGLPESVTDRVRRSHEDWVHLTVRSSYYSMIDQIRDPVLHPDWSRPNRNDTPSANARRDIGQTSALRNVYIPNPNGRVPGSVWAVTIQPFRVPPELGISHFAAFPMEWPRRLIKGWCPPAGIVLDPFGGTGTTALVAAMLGRIGITVDASADYCRLARWRCTDPGERAKAAQVDKPPPVAHGQADLFGAVS
jgi:site-specific DNA-methyltransferase (cytosine-N4-specific)